MRYPTRILRSEKGVALPLVGVFITALVVVAGLGMNSGHISILKSEMQNAADAGAAAGALGLYTSTVNANVEEAVGGNFASGDDTNPTAQALTASNIESVETGRWSDGSGFQSGVTPWNAVRVTTTVTRNNLLFRGGDGAAYPSSNVRAASTAVVLGPPDQAIIPLVIGDCLIPDGCYDDSCMPLLQNVGGTTPQTGWTGLENPALFFNVTALFPDNGAACDAACFGTQTTEEVVASAGDLISTTSLPQNQGAGPYLDCAQSCLLDANEPVVSIPVVSCENFGTSQEVRGFATGTLVSTQSNPAQPNFGLNIQMQVTPPEPGPGGSEYFGIGVVSLAP